MPTRSLAMRFVVACLCGVVALGTGCDTKSSAGPAPEDLSVTTVGSVDLPGFSSMVNAGDISGHYPHEPMLGDGIVYIPDGTSGTGILMVDVTDPSDPDLVGSSTVVKSRDLVTGNGMLLSVDRTSLHVLDTTNPLAPVLLATLPMGDREAPAVAVTMDDTLAFVTGGGPYQGFSPALQTVSIADPEAPVQLDASEEDGGADVAVAEGLAYVTCYDAGLRIYDVSDPDSLELLSQTGTFGNAIKVEVHGSLAYVYNTGDDYSLAIFDVSSPSLPSLLSATSIPDELVAPEDGYSEFHGIRILGDLAFLSGYYGTAVVDVSDPDAPEFIDGIGREEFTGGVEIVDGYVAIVSRSAVTILDVEYNE
jgi:hypothetical protein